MTKLLFFLAILALTVQIRAQTFNYDFTSGYEGWTGDFADYPIPDSISYGLEFTRTTLPAPLNTNKFSLKISGKNHSDDLFMFIKRKITGLLPNTAYRLQIDVEFASKEPTKAVGIGGAPGEGVTVKAGASVTEPKKVGAGNNYYRMNIDKSNQVNPGADMDTIGHVGVTPTVTAFTLIKRSNATHPFQITTNANGEAWVCIGTDSGFEGATTLYYNLITLNFTTTLTGLNDTQNMGNARVIQIFPNPANTLVTIRSQPGFDYMLADASGKIVRSGKFMSGKSTLDIHDLATGVYLLTVGNMQQKLIKD